MNDSPNVKGEERHLEFEIPLKRSLSHDHAVTLPESSKKLQRCKSEDVHVSSSNTSPSVGHHNSSPHHAAGTSTGHRPVTSCTHCRQHKIKCNASDNFPAPCSRCERMGLNCQIDPQFRPKKGSQLQNLRRDVDELKLKIEYLTRNESLIARALQQSSMGQELINTLKAIDVSKVNELANGQPPQRLQQRSLRPHPQASKISVQTFLGASEPQLLQEKVKEETEDNNKNFYKKDMPLVLQMALQRNNSNNVNGGNNINHHSGDNTPNDTPGSDRASLSLSPMPSTYSGSKRAETGSIRDREKASPHDAENPGKDHKRSPVVATTNAIPLLPSPYAGIDEFVIGDVRISIDKANELHHIFVTRFLPYFPIMYTNSVTELYSQSQLLFWTVMLTACLSDPEPSMYIKLAALIKQLAIETCWIRTPRSTHITQALLILCIWPLPNQKVLDDCSYRLVGLAKCLSYQLGLHRGEFISEFTRTQTSMPDAEKWRTRTWLGIFFAELFWASTLGLPPTSQTDYLVEDARMGLDEEEESPSNNLDITANSETNGTRKEDFNEANQRPVSSDHSTPKNRDHHDNREFGQNNDKKSKLPKNFRRLICLAHFQAKLCKVMGSSVVSPDALVEPRDRASSLAILERELESLDRSLNFSQDTAVHIYYLYVRLMVCCFAFLPGTPTEDQSQYVTEAYLCATKVVTLLTSLLERQQLVELPIYVRQSATFAALILFKLQLTPLLMKKFLDSARQSIVTVHRLFRNQLSAWATTVENDISRTASVLEKLNFVLITHPTVFVEEDGIISRMRSHLTGSLFYDLVWCVHEARRREMDPEYNKKAVEQAAANRKARGEDSPFAASDRRLYPLPFYNQISKEDFETIIQTTPGGTTVSTLVPTKTALNNAKTLAKGNKDSNGTIMEINGIPLSMLDETGSVKLENILGTSNSINAPANAGNDSNTSMRPMVGASSNFTDPIAQSLNLGTTFDQKNAGKDAAAKEGGLQSMAPFMNEADLQRANASFQRAHVAASADKRNRGSLFGVNNSTVSSNTLNKSFMPPQVNETTGSRVATKTASNNDDNDDDNTNNNNNTNGNNNNDNNRVNFDNYANLNMFLNSGQALAANSPAEQNGNRKNAINQLSELDTFFQQQSTGWLEGNSSNDDFLGWFDMDMEPKF
ncbi:related to Putative transcription factor SEF1 [Zygosaccharomyces bailii ISA1307]|nr:related to Putative transcription factor SEF1 [Zygosaccharomyces bailii ISA1307]